MRVLIAVDVSNFLCRARHFAIAGKVVEEHKATIKVNTFEDIVGHERLHERRFVVVGVKLVIAITDESVASQQVFIGFPLVKNIVSLFGRANSVEHIAVTLTVNALLESLDMQA